jgi:hypothetical protein
MMTEGTVPREIRYPWRDAGWIGGNMGVRASVPRLPGIAVVILPALMPSIANAGDLGTAVITPGVGVLTKCRNWLVFKSCNSYNNIELPKRIAVGDKVKLTFGSNPKDYVFEVVSIRPEGNGCKILSTESGDAGDDENLMITQCQPAA